LDELRAFPEPARRKAGQQLLKVQQGLSPDDWRPMTSVGPGVAEIRIHTGGEHRVLYLAKFEEAVYVLHAFEKRSRRTARLNREVGRKRLREAVRSRSARK
jgi:phage-related protein